MKTSSPARPRMRKKRLGSATLALALTVGLLVPTVGFASEHQAANAATPTVEQQTPVEASQSSNRFAYRSTATNTNTITTSTSHLIEQAAAEVEASYGASRFVAKNETSAEWRAEQARLAEEARIAAEKKAAEEEAARQRAAAEAAARQQAQQYTPTGTQSQATPTTTRQPAAQNQQQATRVVNLRIHYGGVATTQAQIDSCTGFKDVTSWYRGVPGLAAHWHCGGSALASVPIGGVIEVVGGPYAGLYRNNGVAYVLNHAVHNVGHVRHLGGLQIQTCLNNNSSRMGFFHLTRI